MTERSFDKINRSHSSWGRISVNGRVSQIKWILSRCLQLLPYTSNIRFVLIPWSVNDLCLSYVTYFLLFFFPLELPSVSSAGRCVKASSSRPFCFSSSCLITPENTSHWDGVLDWYFFQHFGIKFQSSCWLRGKIKILEMCESLVLAPSQERSVAWRKEVKLDYWHVIERRAREQSQKEDAKNRIGRRKWNHAPSIFVTPQCHPLAFVRFQIPCG